MTARTAEAERRAKVADTCLKTALEKEQAATAIVAEQQHWAKAVDLVGKYPSILTYDDNGGFRLDQRPERTGKLPDWLVTTLRKPAPPWAAAAIKKFHQLDIAAERLEAREVDAANHLELLQDMIANAGSALRPAQKTVVDQAAEMVRRLGPAMQRRNDGPAM